MILKSRYSRPTDGFKYAAKQYKNKRNKVAGCRMVMVVVEMEKIFGNIVHR